MARKAAERSPKATRMGCKDRRGGPLANSSCWTTISTQINPVTRFDFKRTAIALTARQPSCGGGMKFEKRGGVGLSCQSLCGGSHVFVFVFLLARMEPRGPRAGTQKQVTCQDLAATPRSTASQKIFRCGEAKCYHFLHEGLPDHGSPYHRSEESANVQN